MRFSLPRYLAFVTALSLLSASASASEPTFQVWRTTSADTTTSTESPFYKLRTPAWWDTTGDGHPELVFWSWFGLETLERDAEGSLALSELPTGPDASKTFGDARAVLAIVDMDGDGQDELLSLTTESNVYRVGEETIELGQVPMPPIPLNCLYDAAVGDLNRDGLADVYLAMGCFHSEAYRQTGHPDIVLMNRGNARFEALTLEPTRRVLTTSVTLADVDGDGWLDVLESVDASWASGASRLLMNRSAPGDSAPTFVPSEHDWDLGTDGMGAAIGDLNGDGLLDLYNTSIGFDLLMIAQPSGGYADETLSRGVRHFWSSQGRRTQWAPTFTDLNMDGRMDLLVRHGVRNILNPRTTATIAPDLVYTQQADGHMDRTWTPFTDATDDGVCFAVGDLGGDGIPDVARDTQPGGTLFWTNTTPVEPTTRLLTVHLAATVSGSPATGAVLHASCKGVSLTRTITSGGKVGASAAYEASFAWPECSGESVALTTEWPSGARTESTIPAGDTLWLEAEPRWVEAIGSDRVRLDPAGVGASEACLMNAEGSWTCCESACEEPRPSQGATLVTLEGQTPLALPSLEERWLLVTTPHLPAPGQSVVLTLMHLGDEESFPGEMASLWIDGAEVAWESVDASRRILSARTVAPLGTPALSVSLQQGEVQIAYWSQALGYGIDPKDIHYDLYPNRPVDTFLEPLGWEVFLYAPAGLMDKDVLKHIELTTPEGDPLATTREFMFERQDRLTLSAEWDALTGLDTLLVRDHGGAWTLELPVRQPASTSALVALVDRVHCGLNNSRLRAGKDRSFGALTPLDAEGNLMVISPSSLSLRIEGGELVDDIQRSGELKDLGFHITTDEGEGDGEIFVETLQGEVLGSCTFEREQWPDRDDEVVTHWSTLSKETIDRATADPTTRLRIGLLNDFGELLGAAAWPEVLIAGGTWSSPVTLTDGGTFSGDASPNDEVEEITLTITLSGRVLETLTVSVTGEAPPAENEEAPESDEPSAEEGCDVTGRSAPLWWPWMLLLMVSLRARALLGRP